MGLGKELLRELANIGNEYDMEKIVLTVLKGVRNLLFSKTSLSNSSRKHKGNRVLQGYWVHFLFLFLLFVILIMEWLFVGGKL